MAKVDWGLYGALRYKDDFQQKRQDRADDAQFLQQQRSMVQNDIQQQAAAQSGMMEYFDQLSKHDVLPQDVERVKAKEQELRSGVIGELRKHNGDVRKFMLSGGIASLKDYKNNLVFSEELKKAMGNKLAYSQYVEDSRKGRIARNEFIKNEDGTMSQRTFNDQLKDFQAGKTDRLSYGGSFEAPKIDPEVFLKHLNPDNPMNGGRVRMDTLKNHLLSAGYNPSDLAQIIHQYEDPNKKGYSNLDWGRPDPVEMGKLHLLRQKLRQGDEQVLNVINALQAGQGEFPIFEIAGANGENRISYTQPGVQTMELYKDAAGIREIKDDKGRTAGFSLPTNHTYNAQAGIKSNSPSVILPGSNKSIPLDKGKVESIDQNVYYINTPQGRMTALKVRVSGLKGKYHGEKGLTSNFDFSLTGGGSFSGEAYYVPNVTQTGSAVSSKDINIKEGQMEGSVQHQPTLHAQPSPQSYIGY